MDWAAVSPSAAAKRPRSPVDLHMVLDPDLDLDNLHNHKRFLTEVLCLRVLVGMWRLRAIPHKKTHRKNDQRNRIQSINQTNRSWPTASAS